MTDSDRGHVHQLLLGLKVNEGVTLLGHSMTSDSVALVWRSRLEQHARLLPRGTESPPDKALSYYRFGHDAVVLRRWAGGGSLGRNDAHALVGPAEVLTVPVALGLDSGFDWTRDADAVRTPLLSGDLVSAAEAEGTLAQLREGAARVSEMLHGALGTLMDARRRPLTIIGCPDADRVALTWALVYIGNKSLATSQISRSWTFSTYEIEDTDNIPDLPEILFMPGRPIGRGTASREIVDLSSDVAVSEEADTRSRSLVKRFISGEPLLPECDDEPVSSRTWTVPTTTEPPAQREQERPLEPSVPERHPDQGSAGGSPEDEQKVVVNPPAPSVPPTRPYRSKRLEKELNDLLCAADRRLFELRFTVLSGRDPEERAEIRKLLAVDNYLNLLIAITKWYPSPEEMTEQFRLLRVVTFGSDGRDLSDPDVVEFAVELIRHPAAPDFFVHGLVDDIESKDKLNRVVPVLAAKWRTQHNPARLFAGSRGRRGTAATGRSGSALSRLAQRGWPLVVAGIVLVSLAFLAGRYSSGVRTSGAGSTGQETPTPQTATSPPAGGQHEGEALKQVVVSGGVATKDLVIRGPWRVAGDKTMVFLVLRPLNEPQPSYYAEEACKVEGQEWICDKSPLPTPPTNSSTSFEVQVVKGNSQDMRQYQNFVNPNTILPAPPVSTDVIFSDSGRP